MLANPNNVRFVRHLHGTRCQTSPISCICWRQPSRNRYMPSDLTKVCAVRPRQGTCCQTATRYMLSDSIKVRHALSDLIKIRAETLPKYVLSNLTKVGAVRSNQGTCCQTSPAAFAFWKRLQRTGICGQTTGNTFCVKL